MLAESTIRVLLHMGFEQRVTLPNMGIGKGVEISPWATESKVSSDVKHYPAKVRPNHLYMGLPHHYIIAYEN